MFRGDHMNQVAKIILRVLAVTVGTAYFLSTFYLVASVPELKNIHVANRMVRNCPRPNVNRIDFGRNRAWSCFTQIWKRKITIDRR